MVYALLTTEAVTSAPLSVSCESLYPLAGEMVQVLEERCATGVLHESEPLPPGALAVMLKFCASNRAVAVTLAAGLRLQVVEAPLQAPLQLTKVSPCTALAVRATRLFFAKFADALVQAGPQLIAAGPETMLPWPVPAASFCTVTVTTLPMSSVSAARLLVVSGSL